MFHFQTTVADEEKKTDVRQQIWGIRRREDRARNAGAPRIDGKSPGCRNEMGS